MWQLPKGIPPANASKWRSRKGWDWWGYLLARSLSNPAWHRDIDWLQSVATRKKASAGQHEAPYYAAILASLRRYPNTQDGRQDEEESWDEVLTAIANLSLYVHGLHLEEVTRVWGDDYGRS